MPCILLTIVALLGFLVPVSSGEKVSIGITILLSLIVFLLVLADYMPPNSDNLPLIATFYGN
jgi:hypothetical protein